MVMLSVLLSGGALASFAAEPLLGTIENRTEESQENDPWPPGWGALPEPVVLEKVALQEVSRLRPDAAILDFKHYGSFEGFGSPGVLPPGDVVVVVPECAAVQEALSGKTPVGTLYRADVKELEFSLGVHWPHASPQPCPSLFQGLPGAKQDNHVFNETTALVIVWRFQGTEPIPADVLAGGMTIHAYPAGWDLLQVNFNLVGGILLAPVPPLLLGAHFVRRHARAKPEASTSAETPLETVLGAGEFMVQRLQRSLALMGILGLLIVLLGGFTATTLYDLAQATAQDPAETAARVRHSTAMELLPFAVPTLGALVAGTVYYFAVSVIETRAWSRRLRRVHEDQDRFLGEAT